MAEIHKVGSILFGGALTVITACLLGRLLLSRFRGLAAALTPAEGWVFSYGVGAACLSLLVFLLCSAGLVYDLAFWAVTLVTLAAWWRWGRSQPFRTSPPPDPSHRLWWGVLAIVAVFYGYLYLPHALAPEIRHDAVGYHLGLVGRYYRAHGFPDIAANVYAHLSQGAEMLYLFAYAFGRHSASKLVHFSFLVATAVALLTFARRLSIWRAGVAGVVLFVCSPVVGIDATSAYNDCALAFYVFLAFYGLVIWWQQRDEAWLIVLGILAGFCYSLKYTGFLAVPLVLVVVAYGSWRRLRTVTVVWERSWRVAAVASLFVLPWMVKNALLVGNPVAPFFNQVFPNPYVLSSWEEGYLEYLKHYDYSPPARWVEFAQAPLELTVHGRKFGGLLGPVFLLAPLALLAWRHPLAKPLWGAAALFAIPWTSNMGTRFLIPSLPFISLAMGLVLEKLPRRAAVAAGVSVLLFHTLASWPLLLPKWHQQGFWALVEIPWKAALRLEPEHEYLGRHLHDFTTAQILSAKTESDDRVLSLDSLPEAYFDAELLVTYQGAENEELTRVLLAGAEPDFLPIRALELEWPGQAVHGFRIVQRNQHAWSHWSLSEVRFFAGENELIPESDWRIRADPRPWTAARAFDGNPFTAWNTWELLRDGMSLEVRFPEPLHLTGAELIYPRGQHFVQFEYFVQHATGEWFPLDAQVRASWRPVAAAGVRAWVGEEFRRHNVEFLVTNIEGGGNNFIAPWISKDPAAWGFEEIGRDGPRRIYRTR